MAQLDELRENPLQALSAWFPQGPATRVPVTVRVLSLMFVTSAHREHFRHLAQRVLGLHHS